jgi:hypothetical protein
MHKSYPIVFSLLSIAAVACGHEYSESGATTTTAARAGTPTNDRAIDAITNARCEREARCNNVGQNKTYVSNEGCLTQLRGEAMNSLTASSCPQGINGPQLDKCLADVRGERCENVLDTIGRLANCNTTALCSH